MNLGQNKFLVGLGGALLVGCLGLGWMVFQSYSAFDTANTQYDELKSKLQRLQTLPLYPKASNLTILEDQKKAAADSAVALHQQLLPMAFPLEPLTPEQFQDQLSATAKKLVDKAAANGVALSDKLYLGFAEYKTSTPKPEAAAALGRQLKCIALAVDTMIDRKVTSINKITRTPLPEEADASKTAAAAPTPKATKSALFTKYPFRIEFTADQKSFQAALNDLSGTPKQFFIIQPVTIKNSGDKAPKKADPAERAPVADPAATAAATPKAEKMKYILGAEKLTVDLEFNSVVFASNLPK
ncbi:MAG: Amuc_1100 family pilus-like protein [Chthoniobacteraceae bacterium]|nr:Amuc_1100 family pilus-like protein [Chthoniobacteraceae bacterium]